MIALELTWRARFAKLLPMQVRQTGKRRSPASRVTALALLLGGTLTALGALSGCVTVKAPDKPIVIELNINIKQEVVYRLAADANKSIEEHPELFGN